MAPAMYFCMIACQQIGMGKILGMPETFVDTCHSLKQKAYKCTILCMHVRGCQPDDTGPKPSPRLPQFCKDDVQTYRNTLEPSCCKKRQKKSRARNWFGE